jgi:hypothetical protein
VRAEVRQHTWDSQTNGVVAATFSLRLKGKPTNIDAQDSVFRYRPSCIPNGRGRKRPDNGCGRPGRHGTLYLRLEKGSSTVSGQTSATFNKASAVSGDAGFIPAWLLMPMARYHLC